MKRIIKFVILSCAAISLCSCAAQQSTTIRYFWPAPPDEPKIEWIGTYSSAADFRKSSLLSKITGENEEIYLQRPLTAVGDGNGKVYVTNTETVTIYLFDFIKQEITTLGGETFTGVMQNVNGIAVDGKGYVYASDSLTQKIYVIEQASNKLVKTIELSKLIKSIGRFAIDKKSGHLVIPDFAENKIVVTDLDGRFIVSFGKKGAGDGEFNYPVSVAIDVEGKIVVADSRNARIQLFSPEGKFIYKFGRRGDNGGDFSIIKGVAVDSENHIYVTDGREHRVTIFNSKGEYLLTFGGPMTQLPGAPIAAGGFLVPQGIYIDQNDRIYVADQLNGRFQVFQYLNPRYLAQFPVLAGQAASPPKPPLSVAK